MDQWVYDDGIYSRRPTSKRVVLALTWYHIRISTPHGQSGICRYPIRHTVSFPRGLLVSPSEVENQQALSPCRSDNVHRNDCCGSKSS